jgi:hypothetical protein
VLGDLLERYLEHVGVHDLHRGIAGELLPQALGERVVELHEHEPTHERSEVPGERTGAGADLEDLVFRARLERLDDLLLEILVDQEVLPERFLGAWERPGAERIVGEAHGTSDPDENCGAVVGRDLVRLPAQ